ncbi:MAG: hypothetical protein WCJ35_11495 [Planctomycetota bacterium]
MTPFSMYDEVRVVKVLSKAAMERFPQDQRPPQPGDTATILEIYTRPPGYELECCDDQGMTIWLGGYGPDDLELERIWQAPPE